jgi:hypothetical protein
MKFRNATTRALGVLLYAIGVLLGIALTAGTVWGDLEAALFDRSIDADASLGSLRCPTLIASFESGTVTATIKNPTDKEIERYVRSRISEGYLTLIRETKEKFPIPPGETETLQWTVTADDAVFGYLIFVRVHLHGYYPYPSRQGSCGILVLNQPYLTGRQILALTWAASLLSMAIGLGLWVVGNRPLSRHRRNVTAAMGALAVVVLVAMIVSALGWWVFGLIFLVFAILLIGAIIWDLVGSV